MLFSEIYSAYYNTVAAIIASSQKGELDSDSLYAIVKGSAFPESVMTIGGALESGKWPLIKKDYGTNIKNIPTMPLSLLQKQWLKAVCNDKRVKLFVSSGVLQRLENELKGVEPLYREEDFYLYDQYSDGDPYDDPSYLDNFRTAIEAVHKKKTLKVEYTSRFGQSKRLFCSPCKIEYSQKDDKFRLISKVHSRHSILNIARIKKCEIAAETKSVDESSNEAPANTRASVTLEIYDDRKAMERMMLAFAHFEKSAVQISDYVYRLTLSYDSFDEAELVVRVLSFGPMVRVIEPQKFVNLVKERIEKQILLMKKRFSR